MASAQTLKDKLASETVASFPFDREVVVVKSTATTLEAISALADNHILSAPVINEETGDYAGFVDTSDLVKHIVETQPSFASAPASPSSRDLRKLLAASSRVFPKPVLDVVNVSKNNPFVPIAETDSLLKAAEALTSSAGDAKSVHRVPILDASGKIIKLVTQSAMLKYIEANKELLGSKLVKPISELFPAKDVMTVNAGDSVMHALTIMAEHKFSALPILDETGHVLTNISNSDIRLLAKRDFSFLQMSCLDFVSAVRQTVDVVPSMGRAMAAAITVRPDTHLLTLLGKFAATKVHRLYVVNEKDNVIGVVSLKDVLKVAIED